MGNWFYMKLEKNKMEIRVKPKQECIQDGVIWLQIEIKLFLALL